MCMYVCMYTCVSVLPEQKKRESVCVWHLSQGAGPGHMPNQFVSLDIAPAVSPPRRRRRIIRTACTTAALYRPVYGGSRVVYQPECASLSACLLAYFLLPTAVRAAAAADDDDDDRSIEHIHTHTYTHGTVGIFVVRCLCH